MARPTAAALATAESAAVALARSRQAVLAGALALTACVQPPPAPPPSGPSIDQRVQDLEWRLDALERYVTNMPSAPLRSRAEIEANIHALEAQRVQLLLRYTPAHPDIRDIDLRLRLLRGQLQMLDQAAPAK